MDLGIGRNFLVRQLQKKKKVEEETVFVKPKDI